MITGPVESTKPTVGVTGVVRPTVQCLKEASQVGKAPGVVPSSSQSGSGSQNGSGGEDIHAPEDGGP